MKISVIRLVHWCYQGKYIFAKALACRSSSFHLSVSFGPLGHPVCIPLDSCKRVEANSVEQFLKLFTEKVFKKTKQNKKPTSTAAVKNSLNWLNCLYRKLYFRPESLWSSREILMLSCYQKAEAWSLEQTALYSIALHYLVFIIASSVRNSFLYVALFSLTDLYMCYGYQTIYIAITKEQ